MKSYLLTAGILFFAITSISLSLISEQVFAQTDMMPMSPRQQMSVLNDPSQVQCREGFVMMMRGTTDNPVCVNPNTSLQLADRGWGNFDVNMMMRNNPQQFQGLANSMLSNPNTSKLWYDAGFNPNTNQNLADQITTSMMQNPQRMNPMVNFMMGDPELRQQMIDTMMQNQEMMQTIRGNNTMMGMMMSMDGQPMMMNQGMRDMMSDPELRQQMIDTMMSDPQMMRDMMNNRPMMNMMNQGMMMGGGPMMGSDMMMNNKNMMMGQNQGMMMGKGSMMGKGPGMGQNMMMTMNNTTMMGSMMSDPELRQQMIDQMMQNPQMMRDMMTNNQMRGMMGMNPVMSDWQIQNQQMIRDLMNQMTNDPQIMQQMSDMMLNNPWHMRGMMNNVMGSMMSDPELRQQMIDQMMQNPQMMRNMMNNQDLMNMMENNSIVTDTDFSISSNELKQQMTLDPNLVVIDMREPNSYMKGHIESSSVDVMEGATLDKRIKTMFSKIPEVAQSFHVVLVGDSESKAFNSAQIMNNAGIPTSYLVGGIESWDDNLSTKMTPTVINSKELHQQLQNQDDLYLLDVREPSELEVTMISGSKNIPLADVFVEDSLSEIPTDKPVIIICASGNRATIATYELAQHDIDFQVLEGGIQAWDNYLKENDLPKY